VKKFQVLALSLLSMWISGCYFWIAPVMPIYPVYYNTCYWREFRTPYGFTREWWCPRSQSDQSLLSGALSFIDPNLAHAAQQQGLEPYSAADVKAEFNVSNEAAQKIYDLQVALVKSQFDGTVETFLAKAEENGLTKFGQLRLKSAIEMGTPLWKGDREAIAKTLGVSVEVVAKLEKSFLDQAQKIREQTAKAHSI
jgi:hypothetical protein